MLVSPTTPLQELKPSLAENAHAASKSCDFLSSF